MMRSGEPARRRYGLGLSLMAALAFLFALGAQRPTAPLFACAYDSVPAFNGGTGG